jgi:hypothetical protein
MSERAAERVFGTRGFDKPRLSASAELTEKRG